MLRNAGATVAALLISASISASTCNQPTVPCLQEHVAKQLDALGLPTDSLLHEHYRFEAETLYNQPAAKLSPLQKELMREEKLIQLVQSGKLDAAQAQSEDIGHPLQDLMVPQGAHLIVQKLTLNLDDESAEQLKRERLEASMHQGNAPDLELIEIARHEILGGDPKKGLTTLNNVQVNEFSDIALANELAIVRQLGHASEALFLNPAAAKGNCDQDSDLLYSSVNRFFSPEHQQLIEPLWNTPHLPQAWRAQLALSTLYRNAGACDLLISLHINQVIHSALQFGAHSEQDGQDLIFLLRAIRRYSAL
ncbi:MAG: hypothetical protein VYA55_11690 [Pseudomonadota bacterium]|nr:hypothetical protein [Pseudomonadota bacterium]